MRSPSLFLLCSLLLVPSCRPGTTAAVDPEADALRRILLAQAARHPLMRPTDVYKLLHQAAMGSAHAIDDTVGARLWMEREVGVMGEGPPEPMIDTIAPDGSVVLVHLRPWVAAGRPTEPLLAAFIASAAAIPQDTVRLVRYLAVADSLADQGRLPFGAAPWRDLVTGLRRGGYPAVHHSPEYEAAYRPAYRVVKGSLVP